jgi:phage major head subunit gpT-like protein
VPPTRAPALWPSAARTAAVHGAAACSAEWEWGWECRIQGGGRAHIVGTHCGAPPALASVVLHLVEEALEAGDGTARNDERARDEDGVEEVEGDLIVHSSWRCSMVPMVVW